MEKRIKPDQKYFTKCILVLTSVTALMILGAVIITLIIHLSGKDPAAVRAIWIVDITLTVLLWIIAIPLIRLWINNLSYLITNDRITIYKGILTKKEQNIPFRAITDFALNRSILDRYLGIGSILVQTAGQSQSASGYEGNLAGLLQYQPLYESLRDKLKDEASTVTVEPDAEKSGAVLEEILSELKKLNRRLERGQAGPED